MVFVLTGKYSHLIRDNGGGRYMQHIEIKYLFHSGFCVKIENRLLLFDYFQEKKPQSKSDYLFPAMEYLPDIKTIYVFASHDHFDHFNSAIFQWKATIPNIQYTVSSDCKGIATDNDITIMHPYEDVTLHDIKISTFGSTDEGVSFLVDVAGIKIFHAGDLNWWHWMNESTIEEIDQAEKSFKSEIDKLPSNQIDLAFFPVDPRQGKLYYLGGEYFAEKVRPKLFIPMHFGDQYDVTQDFYQKIAHTGIATVVISHKGQIIFYNKSEK